MPNGFSYRFIVGLNDINWGYQLMLAKIVLKKLDSLKFVLPTFNRHLQIYKYTEIAELEYKA